MKTLAQVKEQLTWRRRCWQKARVCISSRNKDGAGRRRDFAADADARSGAEKTGRCSITRLLGLRENGSFGSSNKLTKTIFKIVLFVRSCRSLKTLSSLAVGHGNTRSLGVAQRTIYHQSCLLLELHTVVLWEIVVSVERQSPGFLTGNCVQRLPD
jgi:hypothetical protein